MFKHEVLNVVLFSEPFFAFEPLPFDEFFPLFVIAFLSPANRIQQKFIPKKFILFAGKRKTIPQR